MTKTYVQRYKALKKIIDMLMNYTGRWKFSGYVRMLKREIETLKEMDSELYKEFEDFTNKIIREDDYAKESLNEIKAFAEEKLKPLYEPFEKESYSYLLIDGLEFKIKAMNYSSEAIYFGIFSFKTKQHAKTLISLINDGKKCQVRNEFYEYVDEIRIEDKKKYKLQLAKANGLNNDGYHGRLFLDKKNIIRIFKNEEPKYFDIFDEEDRIIDRFYNYINNSYDAALFTLPIKETKTYETMLKNINVSEEELLIIIKKWKKYFYDELQRRNVRYCRKNVGNEDYLPKTYIIRGSMINDAMIRKIRTEGLKSGEIVLPVEPVEIDENMSFLDVITKFVIKDIEDEEYHYNIGDELEGIINSSINMDDGKVSYLFDKQKIIGQGIKNALIDKEDVIFLNGGTGVGKTFTSIKTSLQYLESINKIKKGFRIAIYAQGHLIPKWKRQIEQAIQPIGITPIFRDINYLKDVDELPLKPQGAEFLFLSKDKAKRSYSIKYIPNNKYPTLLPIDKFAKEYKKYEDKELIEKLGVLYDKITIINTEGKIENNQLKYAALRIGKFINKHVILYTQIGKDRYVFSTSIKRFNDAFSKMNHIKYFKTKSILKPIKILLNSKNIEVLNDMTQIQKISFSNPLVCPQCGQKIYSTFNARFDLEKGPRYKKFSTRSSGNSVCNAPLHPDGKPFSERLTKIITRTERMKLKEIKEIDEQVSYFLDQNKRPITDEKEIKNIMKGILPRRISVVYVNYTHCNHSLWAADSREDKNDKMRDVNVGKHLKRKFKGSKLINVLIADECHIYSKQSNQGYLYHLLAEQSDKILNLSATITGGKASDLYYMFWRTIPYKMKRMGYEYDDYVKFVENYGRYEKKFQIKEEQSSSNKSGTVKRIYRGKKEIAGISPKLYTNFLSNIMVSRKLEDMDIPMVKLNTFREEIKPDEDLMQGYDSIKEDLLDFGKDFKVNIGGAFLHGLLSYLDNPNQEPIYFKDIDKLRKNLLPKEYERLKSEGKGYLITTPPRIDLSTRLLNKEKMLLKTIEREVKQEGRKMLIYDRYSGSKAVSDRIEKVIKDAGYKVIQLKSKIPTVKREEWIEKKHQEGYDIIITNPKIVQTGLDIVQYPTIYFYNYDFDVKIIRQAEKRAWRPNQNKECRIYYSYYEDTIQEKAIQLIAKKKSASLALEGVFNEDMLSSMGSSESTSISKQLYDALKGKISLKEDHLKELNIKSSNELINNLEKTEEKQYNIEVVETDIIDKVKFDNIIVQEIEIGEQLSFL